MNKTVKQISTFIQIQNAIFQRIESQFEYISLTIQKGGDRKEEN